VGPDEGETSSGLPVKRAPQKGDIWSVTWLDEQLLAWRSKKANGMAYWKLLRLCDKNICECALKICL
jgi:hypothetical protein